MTNLEVLDLGYNQVERLPERFCDQLTNLRELLLDSMHFLQVLPEDIGKLTNLSVLDISDTCLSSLPESVAKLRKLEGLLLGSRLEYEELPPLVLQDIIPNLKEFVCEAKIWMSSDHIVDNGGNEWGRIATVLDNGHRDEVWYNYHTDELNSTPAGEHGSKDDGGCDTHWNDEQWVGDNCVANKWWDY